MIAKKGAKKGTNKSDLKMCYRKKPFAHVLLLVMAATLLLAFLPQLALADTEITTCTELQNMSLTGDYYLSNDIDCTGTSGWNGGAGFEPIGNESNNFSGTFDGQGYKITGLYINRCINQWSTGYAGLFGFTGSGSEIKDVGLEQVDVCGCIVGGLVGYNMGGTITNCYSTGSVIGDTVAGGLVGRNIGKTFAINQPSSDYASLFGFTGSGSEITNVGLEQVIVNSSWLVGSFVGGNEEATITNCYSTGSVFSAWFAGGLVGENMGGTIANSYSTGSVCGFGAGGLVGFTLEGTIANSYSTGSVSGCNVGGLVGYNRGTITNSYWDIITSRQLSSAGGDGKTTTEMKQRATFENWDFVNIWAIVEDESYPYLQWQPEPPVPVPVFSITGLVVVIGMMCLVLAVTVSRRRR